AEARVVRAAGVALAAAPAVVRAAGARRDLEVDLLAQVLADVADVEVARQAIEAVAPGVAQPEGPDLVVAVDADERIRGRDAVGEAAERIDAQHLAEQVHREVLRVADPGRVTRARVAGVAAVARRDVEEAV